MILKYLSSHSRCNAFHGNGRRYRVARAIKKIFCNLFLLLSWFTQRDYLSKFAMDCVLIFNVAGGRVDRYGALSLFSILYLTQEKEYHSQAGSSRGRVARASARFSLYSSSGTSFDDCGQSVNHKKDLW